MSKRTYSFYSGTARQWRRSMRKRLRDAITALQKANVGCAYNPSHANGYINQAITAAKAELDSCREDRWLKANTERWRAKGGPR